MEHGASLTLSIRAVLSSAVSAIKLRRQYDTFLIIGVGAGISTGVAATAAATNVRRFTHSLLLS
jgi:predicted RNase H-like nuclease (RuvC/YqgF family)